jgi:formate hydrogenlyase subunit 6/NADH:ubiquinone oxidoreductase subunit I
MRYPKLRELKEAVISLFSPAYTTRFPVEQHIPFVNFRGKPVVDDANCVGCETCANVCPSHAITFRDDAVKQIRIIERNYGACIFCGQCAEHCITKKGVKLSDRIFDLATFDRSTLVESQVKELLICKNCDAVVTTKQHFEYIHNKLGPMAYASILNLNMLNERLKLEDPGAAAVEVLDSLKRKDMFNVLCPDCLRKVLLKSL